MIGFLPVPLMKYVSSCQIKVISYTSLKVALWVAALAFVYFVCIPAYVITLRTRNQQLPQLEQMINESWAMIQNLHKVDTELASKLMNISHHLPRR